MIVRLVFIVQLLIVLELLEVSRANDNMRDYQEEKGQQKTLLTIVQAITSDPEYLALTYEQQYSVIETILDFIVQYKREKNGRSLIFDYA
jgi:hypothetical protein